MRRVALAAVLLIIAAGLPAQTFDDALATYERGDLSAAAKAFRNLADQGDAKAQFWLGYLYDMGEGVAEDKAEAVRWYRKAAEQGYAQAQCDLGVMYEFGEGVAEDKVEAVRWYRKAADQGYAKAQFLLGLLYAKGEGVPQDKAEAARWYRKAADQGNADAKLALDRLSSPGGGEPRASGGQVATSKPAAEWEEVSADNKSIWYVNRKSVRVDRNLRYFWVKTQFATPEYKSYAEGYVSTSLDYWTCDCSSGTMAVVQSIGRDAYEKTLFNNSFSNHLDFQATPPGSIGEVLQRIVCAIGTPREEASRAEGGQKETEEASTVGSGFVVSAAGGILTNAHVVSACEVIRVTTGAGEQHTALLAAADPQSDLALLWSRGRFPSVAAFRLARPLRLGEEIVALGYPLHGLLASGVNVSTGTVSALAGIANDSTKVQISAPVQPGNSGGPVLDLRGAVVGIVVSKLDAIKMAKAIGDIPQNVNFAIKADVARLFLEAQGVSLQSAQAGTQRSKADVAATGREFTVLVECLKGQDAK